ncbi:protein FAM221B-like [Antedon mediterranea]|uniref:protein FAM221B-like n=1 Tax=Antedon mediterranea TaxID=105859 RepID=UPI003AF8487B
MKKSTKPQSGPSVSGARSKTNSISSTKQKTGKPVVSRAVVPKNAQNKLVKTPKMQAIPMKKMADGTLHPEGYTVRPVIPAEKAELISVARAMHREEFGPRMQKLFQPETDAALQAIQTGVYVGWRLPGYKFDCIRVGHLSRCFCGHILQDHAKYNARSLRVPCGHCECKAFAFVPGRPEDVGEFWFQRRRNFDPSTWRAKCRCKHTHEEHKCTGMRHCKIRGCGCGAFNSNFLCAACDKHWEQHETVFEGESERRQNGIPCGEEYLPFAEMPDLRNMALTGVDSDPGIYRELVEGKGSIPQGRQITQDTPVRPNATSAFKPVWD